MLEVFILNTYNYKLVACDTDSIKICKENGCEMTNEEMDHILNEMNRQTPELINLEADGYYNKFLVLKSKNYVTVKNDKIKYRGSSLIDQKKEPALRQMLKELIDVLLKDITVMKQQTQCQQIYHTYIQKVYQINKDTIQQWCTKKTITKSIFESPRLNETKVKDAIADIVTQEGDKVYLYNAISGYDIELTKSGKEKQIPKEVLKRPELYDNDIDHLHYIKRVHDTALILQNVLDKELFINYTLKRNKDALNLLIKGE